MQEDKAKSLISKHTNLVGQLFVLSPESVDKLNLDSQDSVCDQLASINHKEIFFLTQMRTEGCREEGGGA